MLKLQVLSGGLSGRTFEFEQSEVRLGRHPACDIAFDATRDDSVGRWHAHLRLEGNSWSVENLHENGTFLNGNPVIGKLVIRSGDSLRLARDGPEIRITVVAPPAGPAASPQNQNVRAPVLLSPDRPQAVVALPSVRSHSSANAWIGIASVGVVTVALAAVMLIARGAGHKDVTASKSPSELDSPTGAQSATQTNVSSNESGDPPTNDTTTQSRKEPQPPDPWQSVAQQNRRSVYALAAEQPNGLGIWPMGAGTAVREDLLVTTASVATQLETLRRESWKIWRLGSEANSASEISDIKVHIGYVKSAEKPEHQAFFDMALLTLRDKVPEVCEIASGYELDALDAREPFGCLALSLPAGDSKDPPEPIGRFDVLAPELVKGRIQGLLQLSRDPGAPRMLLLPALMPSHIWGSPVLNSRGKLVAVCTEAAQKTDTGQVRLNYAALVASVADWLKGEGQELWVPVPQRANP